MSLIKDFITRWQGSGAAERSNYALFISELCDLLEVPRPDPSSEKSEENDYVIDRAFTRKDKDDHSSTVYLDLYKRGHFVLETKQGSSGEGDRVGHGKRGTRGWDKALDKAYHQARAYIRDLPEEHGRPPFLIVVDVGHCIDLYAEFSGTGGTYLAYPTPTKRRIFLEDLKQEETRQLLRTIWTDPASLDPSKHAAKVTREVAATLAELATSLEKDGHDPQIIATFLQRLLFTLFAEDVGLLPEKSFEKLLEKSATNTQAFISLVTQLWKEMSTGTPFSTILMQEVIHFNGGLFENPSALPLAEPQIKLLVHAAKQDWKEVEPAIFGTLLERALDPTERHKLGAHYTPRSYVERLIEPTLMQPLRDQWQSVKTAAALLHDQAEAATPGSSEAERLHRQAREEVTKFHNELSEIKVLDPACGSANFLYVALARIKELEASVLDLLADLGGDLTLEMSTHMVRPDHFYGIEVNPRAASIAQLVLWIGYFQWHHKTTGKADTNERPLLPKQQTIECRDAVLDYDEKIPRKDPDTGEFITIWDGHSTKPHPVTGKEVPDESRRTPLFDYVNPRRTTWPEADYIIGNPPFLGASRMRDSLGDGYTEALRKTWKKFKPDSWDFVMFWWHQAAELVRDGKTSAFGFITTNSIHQTFNRRCIEPFLGNAKKPVSIVFAIPDHPWVDSTDGADVRTSMTSVTAGNHEGILKNVSDEQEVKNGEISVTLQALKGKIFPNLKTGVDISSTTQLSSNETLSSKGVMLIGAGFLIDETKANEFKAIYGNTADNVILNYRHGKDISSQPRNLKVIDLHGYEEDKVKNEFPSIFQHLTTHVKPDRMLNREKYRRENWWLFGRKNLDLRAFIDGLPRFISTIETSKHRYFVFLDKSIRPDNKLVNIGLHHAEYISLLSSSAHVAWALECGARLEDRPVYVKTTCFETFPFPDVPDGELKTRLRDLGEQLDSHRKARQAEHPDLTLTGMYNVLEKLRSGEPLTAKEKTIHDDGLVTILQQIHDDIDQAVYQAYGWQDIWQWQQDARTGSCYDPETDIVTQLEIEHGKLAETIAPYLEQYEQVLLQRLVDLNHERAAEEARGKIRYLRPEFQDPDNTQKEIEQNLNLPAVKAAPTTAKSSKLKWPKTLPEQVACLQDHIPAVGTDAEALSLLFGRTSKKRITEITQILQTLSALGQI